MITADGYIDWALRAPGPAWKRNSGENAVKGIILHSAEGYEAGMIAILQSMSQVSWHLSNMKDGRLVQHYPLVSRCWHATAANNEYVGMEHEGRVGEPLTEVQIETAVRVIQDISEEWAWKPTRPASATDTTHTLWEHREVVRLGGTPTACPSGRIPWGEILVRLEEDGDQMELAKKEHLLAQIVATLKRPDYELIEREPDAATGERIIEVLSGVTSDEAIRIRIR